MSLKSRAGLLLLAGACASPHKLPPSPEPPPLTEVRRVHYAGGQQLKKRYVVLNEPGRPAEKHGVEEEWYENGARKAERSFSHGLPSGTWRTWYRAGTPESVVEIGDGTELLPMRWWYEDGAPRAEGQGRGGVREGPWVYYHRNGLVAERGAFAASRRTGPWVAFDAEGKKRAEGEYREGRRTGTWSLWDEHGVLHLKEAAAAGEGVEGDGLQDGPL